MAGGKYELLCTQMFGVLPPLAIPLALVFGAYVALIPLFAVAYYREYFRDRKGYAFASIILHTQAATFVERAQEKLIQIQAALEALSTLYEKLGDLSKVVMKASPWFHLRAIWNAEFPGGKVSIERAITGSGVGGPSGAIHTIRISFDDGKTVSRAFSESVWDDVDLTRLLHLWVDTAKSEQAALQERLVTIDSDTPAVWTFLDFLYFSVITQTTVGYGDILPNCTRVRLYVSSQILAGYALLVIAVNLVLSGHA